MLSQLNIINQNICWKAHSWLLKIHNAKSFNLVLNLILNLLNIFIIIIVCVIILHLIWMVIYWCSLITLDFSQRSTVFMPVKITQFFEDFSSIMNIFLIWFKYILLWFYFGQCLIHLNLRCIFNKTCTLLFRLLKRSFLVRIKIDKFAKIWHRVDLTIRALQKFLDFDSILLLLFLIPTDRVLQLLLLILNLLLEVKPITNRHWLS